MTTDLDRWLQTATLWLSKESTAQVQTEIQEHYESAREAATESGATADDANRTALSALGSAWAANRQYRRVLLTASEARDARECGRGALAYPWVLSSVLEVIFLAPLLAAGVVFDGNWFGPDRVILALALAIGSTILAARLPVYTVSRARIFRRIRWILQAALWVLWFRCGAPGMPWLAIVPISQVIWTEWKRAAIRRKLPVSDWPRQLSVDLYCNISSRTYCALAG